MNHPENQGEKPKHDFYMFGYQLSRLALWAMYEQHIEGADNFPLEPSIIVMNHQKVEDTFLVAKEYTKQTHQKAAVVAQVEYFRGEGIRGKDGIRRFGAPVKLLVDSIGAISADRDGDMGAMRQLSTDVTQTLENGMSVIVHSDSKRAKNGMVNKFYPTFTRLAVDNNVPLVPVGGHYSETDGLRSKRIDLHIGEPLMPEYYHSILLRLLPKNRRIDHINNELEKRVALLAALEQSHQFAPKD